MLQIILSLILLYIGYTLLRKVYYEPKSTAATFAIIIFLGSTLLFAKLLAPTTTTITKIGINQLSRNIELSDFKSNKDIVDKVNILIESGKDTLVIEEIRYNPNKYTYLRHVYPKKTMIQLINGNRTYLK